jgi:hypothetical protein
VTTTASWDAWAPLPKTELAERYFAATGTLTAAGQKWQEQVHATNERIYRSARAQVWSGVWVGPTILGVAALVMLASSVALAVVTLVVAVAWFATRAHKQLGEVEAQRRRRQEANEQTAALLCSWAQLTEVEREAIRASRRKQRRKDVAVGVAVAPLLLVGGAAKVFGLDGLLDVFGG